MIVKNKDVASGAATLLVAYTVAAAILKKTTPSDATLGGAEVTDEGLSGLVYESINNAIERGEK